MCINPYWLIFSPTQFDFGKRKKKMKKGERYNNFEAVYSEVYLERSRTSTMNFCLARKIIIIFWLKVVPIFVKKFHRRCSIGF